MMTEHNDDNNIIPFGKHKGKTIDEVQSFDPQYLEWLCGQEWFRDKFVILHQTIINRGAEPEETPEHNALQILFLEDSFCEKFLGIINPEWYDKTASKLSKFIGNDKASHYYHESDDKKQKRLEALDKLTLSSVQLKISKEFEVHGVDVILTFEIFIKQEQLLACNYSLDQTRLGILWAYIEIKPIVGDDYPAVLRQMRSNMIESSSNHMHILLLKNYNGKGATKDQLIKFFYESGVNVLFLSDIVDDDM